MTDPRLVVRTRNGGILLDVPVPPGTGHEVVLPNTTRLAETSIEYRRKPQ